MSWREVDMRRDPRRGQFEYFSALEDPWAGLTAEVDVTEFLSRLGGRSFFLSFLYAATRAANAVPQLRRRLRDGGVIEYDACRPSYTLMGEGGVYVYCRADDGRGPYGQFLDHARQLQAQALARAVLEEEADPLGFFFVSSIPWLHYTHLRLPRAGREDSNPRISWGKYRRRDGGVTLPVSLFVHHALADGWHIAQFYQRLEGELAALAAALAPEHE